MDRMTEMEAFATVVDQGGFTDAARKLGLSKSAVSKHVTALEARLGTRLLDRTTRQVSPTEIGMAYFDRARRVLSDAGEAEALVASMSSAPSGELRLSVAADFGARCLSPLIGRFLDAHPGLGVSMVLEDRCVDIVAGGYDMAVRMGELADSALRARRLLRTTRRLVASPGYLAAHGRPGRIEDLPQHRLLCSTQGAWRLTALCGTVRRVRTAGALAVNDGQTLLNAAVAGRGIAWLPDFLLAEAMSEGLLAEAMPDLPPTVTDIHAVYPPGRFTQPKVRAFIDFAVAGLARAENGGG